MTFADLRDARIGPLRQAADAWVALSTACASLEQQSGAELTGPLRASGWQGPAASAALYRMDELDDEFEVAALHSRTAASVLRAAAEDFQALQDRLTQTVNAATGLGLRVDGTGRVTAPAMNFADRHDPDAELIRHRAVQNAGIYTDLIARVLTEATEIDNRIARALGELKAGMPGQHAWEYNNVTDGAAAAAAALGVSLRDIPPRGADPAAVRTWWDGLSADERHLYLTAYPDRLGALDGLPAVDRNQANQLALRGFIGDNVNNYRDDGNPQHDTALVLLNHLEGAENAPEHKRMYLLSVDPLGDGRAAVAIGNPDTARHTAVLVPGVGTELDSIRGLTGRADALQEAALALDPGGPPVAVVAWLGYDPPSLDTDIPTAAFGGRSRDGAEALDDFVNGLRIAHDDSPSHVTVVGHSYGSTVLGEAASRGDGLAADDIVAVGSPGMRVDNVGEFHTDPRHVWAGAAADDNLVARPEKTAGLLAGIPVVGSWLAGGTESVHGPGPHHAEFGGNVLHVETSGHSGYWDQGSQVLQSQAAVIIGDYGLAELDHGRAPSP